MTELQPRAAGSSAGPQGARPWARRAVLVASVSALALLWWLFNVHLRMDFWSFADDYAILSFAHALNVEQWLGEGEPRRVGFCQAFHPGIPFQLASWAAFRAGRLFNPPDAGDPVLYALENPESFWLANRLSALLLSLAGVAGIWWLGRRSNLGFLCAALVVFFSFNPAWTYGLMHLGNDSFALPLAVAFFGFAHRAFTAERNGTLLWAAVGGLGGLALLAKLNYVTWPVAAGLGLLVQLVVRGISLRQFAGRGASFALGFSASVGIIGGLILGPRGLRQMINYHRGVAFHKGRYGLGERGLVDWNAVAGNLGYIAGDPSLWVLTALLLTLAAVALFRHRGDRAWLRKNLPFGVCLAAAVLLVYAAALKHFDHHYLLPAAAVLPVVVLWLGESMDRRLGYAVAAAAVSLACVVGAQHVRDRSQNLAQAEAMRRELQAIRELPLDKGYVRLWARTQVEPFLADLVVWMANLGEQEHLNVTRQLPPQPDDAVYSLGWGEYVSLNGAFSTPDAVPWRYAIFDRYRCYPCFPTFESLPEHFRQNGQQVDGFEEVLVVVRRKGD